MARSLPILVACLLAASAALAQTNIKPDPTPRVPPQPGQGLPVEDLAFFSRASNLSAAQIELGRLAAQKGTDPAIKELGQSLVAEHEKMRQSLTDLAARSKAEVKPHESEPWWRGQIERLKGLSGQEFDREFVNLELQAGLALVNLYQRQASNTPQAELARYAIIALVPIQRAFERARQLGGQFGLKVDTVRQPPQY